MWNLLLKPLQNELSHACYIEQGVINCKKCIVAPENEFRDDSQHFELSQEFIVGLCKFIVGHTHVQNVRTLTMVQCSHVRDTS